MHRLLVLVLLATYALPADEVVVGLNVHLVSDAVFQADVAPGWEMHLGEDGAWTQAARTLRIPASGDVTAVPIPDGRGRLDAEAWQRFLGSRLNPQRNAVRLLGRPDAVLAIPGGGVELRWSGERLRNGRNVGLPHDCYSLAVTIMQGTFAWKQSPIPESM